MTLHISESLRVSYVKFPRHILDDGVFQAFIQTHEEETLDKLNLVEEEDEYPRPTAEKHVAVVYKLLVNSE